MVLTLRYGVNNSNYTLVAGVLDALLADPDKQVQQLARATQQELPVLRCIAAEIAKLKSRRSQLVFISSSGSPLYGELMDIIVRELGLGRHPRFLQKTLRTWLKKNLPGRITELLLSRHVESLQTVYGETHRFLQEQANKKTAASANGFVPRLVKTEQSL